MHGSVSLAVIDALKEHESSNVILLGHPGLAAVSTTACEGMVALDHPRGYFMPTSLSSTYCHSSVSLKHA